MMRIVRLRLTNFRCFKDTRIECGKMHALVGTNSAGKSTILHALDFLFNASATKITKDWFHMRDWKNEARVEAIYCELTKEEQEAFKGYLRPDNTFHLSRSAKWTGEADDAGADVSQSYNKPQPKIDWLNPDKIGSEEIKVWAKVSLTVNDHSFSDFIKGEKPTVGMWKEKAAEFSALHLKPQDLEDTWSENPKGFSGVLKGNLPHFELVPAVRDVGDEGKVLKTNPFGRLIHSILEKIDPAVRESMEVALIATAKNLNRSAGKDLAKAEAKPETAKDLSDGIRYCRSNVIPF